MKTLLKSWIVRAVTLLLVASTALAQDRVPFRQAELDQMLAPVALYPDSLLSQMLMASTYPLEVVQAARWSRANAGLRGQDAVAAVERMDWDPSVKSLTAFPQVLARMDENLEWTERLGEAFLAQQADVMATVQELRRRAEAAGYLRSSDQMRVVRQEENIVVESPAPQVVYVPHYSPAVVYGPWWWPAYPPVYWGPPVGYYAGPAYAPGFYWGSGILISAGFFFGHFDWHHRHVNVAHAHPVHGRPVHTQWSHDSKHRRGVPFRNADAHRRFEQSRSAASRPDSARGERGHAETRAGHFRTAALRQRNLDERRSTASGDRQTVDRDGRRGYPQNRLVTGQPGARADHAAHRGIDRPTPAAGPGPAPSEARDFRPRARDNAADSGTRVIRPAPSAAGERSATQPQARALAPQRPAATSPAARTVGSTSQAPAARADFRPAVVPAPRNPSAPQRAAESGRRLDARSNGSAVKVIPQQRSAPRAAVAPAPRPAATMPAPRMSSAARPADTRARPRSSGAPRGERAAVRDNGRRF